MQSSINRYASVMGVLFTLFYSQTFLADGIRSDEVLGFHITALTLAPSQLGEDQSAVENYSLPLETNDSQAEIEVTPVSDESPLDSEPEPEPEPEDIEETSVAEEVLVIEDQPDGDTTSSGDDTPPDSQENIEIVNPAANLTVSSNWVDPGQSINLSWSSEAVTHCMASGHWQGSKAIAGSISVGPIFEDSSYTLHCEGEDGSVVAIIAVRVRSAVLSWVQPKQNTDGSPLTDLSFYRVYIGSQPGIYTQTLKQDADLSRTTINLVPGQYYFAISSFDSDNNESELSEELSKLIK